MLADTYKWYKQSIKITFNKSITHGKHWRLAVIISYIIRKTIIQYQLRTVKNICWIAKRYHNDIFVRGYNIFQSLI